ncbi:unnamed protein product [Gordionus sp. m RMFG-2023]
MKTLLFFIGSFFVTSLVIGNAFYQKKQFYPAIVYLTKSNPSLAIIYLQIFVFALALVKFTKTLYFGQLRPAEVEHIMEKGWFAITETCLAFTLFRDEFTPRFIALFGFLLVVKCFHWIGEERVDYMERSPIITILFKIRMIALIITLTAIDTFFVNMAYYETIMKGASVQLVFGFEYAVLFLLILNIHIKFTLHLVDLRSVTPWENKATYLLFLELIMGFLRVVLYLAFLLVMMRLHTFPLFAVRPMYMAFKKLKGTAKDLIMSRRAINYMNTRYPHPDPTTDFPGSASQGLAGAQNLESSQTSQEGVDAKNAGDVPGTSTTFSALLCIICREEMKPQAYTACKKLPCSHIFHSSCLAGWFRRQQTCPTCRLDVLKAPPAPVIPAGSSFSPQNANGANPETMLRNAYPYFNPGYNPQLYPLPPNFNPAPNFLNFTPNVNANTINPNSYGYQFMPTPPFLPPPPFFWPFPPRMEFNIPTNDSSPAAESVPGTSSSQTTNPTDAPNPSSFSNPGFIPSFPTPPNLASLSEEELRTMEGNEKRNLENRIQCLRNIQILLDSAVIQMHQYTTVVTNLRSPDSTNNNDQIFGRNISNDATSNRSSKPSVITDVNKKDEISTAITKDTTTSIGNTDPEIRKRRLEKLEKTTS